MTVTPTRKSANTPSCLPMSSISEPQSAPLPPPSPPVTPLSTAMSRMASTSSISAMAKVLSANRRPSHPRLSNVLAAMEVELSHKINPSKKHSNGPHSSTRPTQNPPMTMNATSHTAGKTTAPPNCRTLRKLNPSPIENIRNITPRSESIRMLASFLMSAGPRLGPTIMPARM